MFNVLRIKKYIRRRKKKSSVFMSICYLRTKLDRQGLRRGKKVQKNIKKATNMK